MRFAARKPANKTQPPASTPATSHTHYHHHHEDHHHNRDELRAVPQGASTPAAAAPPSKTRPTSSPGSARVPALHPPPTHPSTPLACPRSPRSALNLPLCLSCHLSPSYLAAQWRHGNGVGDRSRTPTSTPHPPERSCSTHRMENIRPISRPLSTFSSCCSSFVTSRGREDRTIVGFLTHRRIQRPAYRCNRLTFFSLFSTMQRRTEFARVCIQFALDFGGCFISLRLGCCRRFSQTSRSQTTGNVCFGKKGRWNEAVEGGKSRYTT